MRTEHADDRRTYDPLSLLAGRGPRPTYDRTELIQKIADGETVRAIARQSGIHFAVLQRLLHDLRRRLGLRTNAQLVAHCLRNGWID